MKNILIASLSFILVGCKSRNFASLASPNDDAVLKEFFAQEDWPHYSDYVKAFGKMPELNRQVYLKAGATRGNGNSSPVFGYASFEKKGYWTDFAEIYKAIAGLEYAYPNAEYGCVGRDVMLICDMIDVFYQTYAGEKRVKYIGVSGTSFEPIRDSMAKMLEVSKKLLLTVGFNPKVFASSNPRPFVLIDATGWSAENNDDPKMSQVRILLKAAYEMVRDLNFTNESVVEFLGAVGTSYGAGKRAEIAFELSPNFELKEYFSFVKNDFKNGFDHPSQIMRMDLRQSSYGSLFWHDKFGEIETDSNGKTKAKISRPFLNVRGEVFNRMVQLNAFVLSDGFKVKMKEEARRWKLWKLEKLIESIDEK